MDVLFVASEMHPLVKTGGLADVAGHLPPALEKAGHRVTVVLPAYASFYSQIESTVIGHVATISGYALIREVTGRSGPRLWLVDHPVFTHRDGNPYVDNHGEGYADNGFRFGLFCQVVSRWIEQSNIEFDVVHCNDWQTGLIPVYLSAQESAPPVLFTIHNLAYQGNFPADLRYTLELPEACWHMHGVEFYGQLSFMKAGLQYSQKLSTVSPNYAHEILQEEFSCGMDGVLRARESDLSGIINGIDDTEWNPALDPHILVNFQQETLAKKLDNKRYLQRKFGLPESDALLIASVGRLAEQKGMDLILEALPQLLQQDVQLLIVGSGDKGLERRLQEASDNASDKMACFIGYDEALAHQVEAGADAFLMPSRFEPCGLNQMYSMAYGTLPIVTPTGGLMDTVIDADADQATGFVMAAVSSDALVHSVERALLIYADSERWQQLQMTAMSKDFAWTTSSNAYGVLYQLMQS